MNLKDRMQRAGPIWKRIVRRTDSFTRVAAITGGAAGAHTVTGIRAGDKLIGVLHYTPGGSSTMADLTSEFIGSTSVTGNGAIIAVDNQIDNTGGTSTASDTLIVFWEAYEER